MKTRKDKVAILSFNIGETLMKKFKEYCDKNNYNRSAVMRDLITKLVTEKTGDSR